MKKIIFCLIVCLNGFLVVGQNKPAYTIYSSDGTEVSYDHMRKGVADYDIVFFGEFHDNPIAHWLELEVTKDLFTIKGKNLMMGAEMFEADNQLIMDEYLSGLIPQKRFEEEIRLWNNYKTDYKPLVEFAKSNGLKFVATNIPRRYASIVSTGGFEALQNLSDEAKRFIAPLPFEYDSELPGYKAMLQMGGMPGKPNAGAQNMPKAQASKDATMAHFIIRNMTAGTTFIHYNGSYHSNNHEGIVWYINKYNPKLKVVTITTVTQSELSKLSDENKGLADFIIVVPESMTRTY